MNLPHLHLLLNHVPTIGTIVAVGLLWLALIRKQEGLTRVALEAFCVVTLVTLPAYLSGVGTQPIISEMPGVDAPAILRHHDAAFVASVVMVATGFLAWLALWKSRRHAGVSKAHLVVVLAMSIMTLGLMGRAANIGGEIRHPEMLDPAAEAAETAQVAEGSLTVAIAEFVNDSPVVWPSLEALHFIGLWLLFGVVVVVNIRLLGMLPQASFAALHRLLPWAALGLCVNLVTGMLFVVAQPAQYMQNVAFFWKIGLLLLAGAHLLYLTGFDEPWEVGPGARVPFRPKALAVTGIVAWFGVMYFGRMLPFIGNAF